MQNHKNLITLLVILFFVASVGILAYEINSNIQTQNEIRLALEQSQASKGGSSGGGGGSSIVISSLTTGSITQTGATISWTTNQPATTQVSYGTSQSYGLTTNLDKTLVTTHTASLTNLTPNTLYYYQAISGGSKGAKTTQTGTFTTLTASCVSCGNPPQGCSYVGGSCSSCGTLSCADTTPPTVSISSPANGATLSSTQTISASASDNVGVSKVVFQIDGSTLTTDTSAPYTANWDTTQNTNTTHTITATAYDAAGNHTSATESVTVSNAVQSSPSGTIIFQDGFESGTFANWAIPGQPPANLWSYDNPFIATSPSPVHSGTYSYGQRYESACCNAGDANRFIAVILPGQNEVYTRGYVYIKSPEPDATAPLNSLSARKLIEWGDSTSGANCCGNYLPLLAVWNGANGAPTSNLYLTWGEVPCGGPSQTVWNLGTFNFDSWHELEVHLKLNTPQTVYSPTSDGVVEIWLDGVKIYGSTTENIRGTCSTPLTGYFFGRQEDNPASTTLDEYRYWDDIAIGTAYLP